MTTVVVAEKPSVARDIARVLGVRQQGEGCLGGAGELEAELVALAEAPAPGEASALDITLRTLWRLVSHLPAGRALKRRAGKG